jgi:L-2,4-diaminobutyrate transaminase
MLCAIELVEDRDTRTFFDPAKKITPQIVAEMARRGVIARAMPQGDIIGYAPPLCLSREEADTVVSVTAEAIKEVLERR